MRIVVQEGDEHEVKKTRRSSGKRMNGELQTQIQSPDGACTLPMARPRGLLTFRPFARCVVGYGESPIQRSFATNSAA